MRDKVFQLKRELGSLSTHLAVMLDGAMAVLGDKTNPMRFASASHALRELLRETLAHFSPDAQIKDAKWFVANPSSRSGITRRHRATFAVYGYVSPSAMPKSLAQEVEDLVDEIDDHADRLSAFTHTTADVLAKPESEGTSLVASTLDLFPALLAAIARGQETLIDEIQMALTTALDDIFINGFFDELDILSTHTRPTGAEVVEVSITKMGKDAICFTGTGSVACDLQYGSDGDCRRGDGVERDDSFPFRFEGQADVMSLDPTVDRENVSVDTSRYCGDEEVESGPRD